MHSRVINESTHNGTKYFNDLAMDYFLQHIAVGGDWREGITERCDAQVIGQTPLGKFHGRAGVNLFLTAFSDIIPDASIQTVDVLKIEDQVNFLWKATGTISEVKDGKVSFTIGKGRIVKFDVRCSVIPLVLNQG